ncbi:MULTISPECIES: amidophosphoribosyltransferase [Chromohalobacter]|uniref:Amidophosphoribosyltransferase n=1 Tax=Chromohalobacter israelensis (strain ATCC BAA-138 / DSM 3043 / CIP 106854 / NCIMB 13768 / 1H11) TaxID=290398 RepID=Q1QY36_CHRI1|nr:MULTISPECIES: amidophosphoribosyltransferase [Chromohalobacter]ABE58622.1 amidophosphoribosyltransferase [Chromohalobacter salexigens DSM 3043]MBZ5875336.1 amidophosphoribosyltransferase [Chromohalobacter salexigens]MDF9433095.1 amidophosphoribosyltransferase [Chromohalobacter israelensis]MDO0944744.1 amidophosphoribosyltransferase [Chromohalobacter salexigens]NQY44727.1 amidophosphoribosyltransferase [Chromohalobacter sp.]
MCGIVGLMANQAVNQSLYDALTVLQHRGQDAAGMMTWHEGRFLLRKSNGLVRDVFHTRHMTRLRGNMGIGHIRYPTAGSSSEAESQPFYVNSPYGISLAHNGNLTNSEQLKRELFFSDLRHINTSSDSEVLLNVFAHELGKQGHHLTPDDIFDAVRRVHRRCQGGYAAVAFINGFGMVAFRDPHGIRPVVYGTRDTEEGQEVMIASESVALDVGGFELCRDLAPGEAIFIETDGNRVHTQQCADRPRLTPCIFEHVYLARPDSILDGAYVYGTRMEMGRKLGDRILRDWPEHDIDVVIPIPDTSRTSALELAQHLGVTYREGFMKNRYIGRTFIMPGQTQRKKSVRQKLNAIDVEFQGKNVLLVDDSIVRGTTCKQIIQMAREAGARKVYFASAAPPVRYPNVYGIDMPVASELIAHGRSDEEVGELIGADRIVYQELEDLKAACRDVNPTLEEFDCSVFDGQYVTGDIDAAYLADLEAARNDLAKHRENTVHAVVDLHNDVEEDN